MCPGNSWVVLTQSSIQKLAFTALAKVQEKTTKINHLSVKIVHQWCQASSEKCKSQTSVFPLEELQYLLAIVAIGKICHYEPSTLLCDISLLSGWWNIHRFHLVWQQTTANQKSGYPRIWRRDFLSGGTTPCWHGNDKLSNPHDDKGSGMALFTEIIARKTQNISPSSPSQPALLSSMQNCIHNI